MNEIMQLRSDFEEWKRLFRLHKHLSTDMTQKLDKPGVVALGTTAAATEINPLLGNVFTITPSASIALTVTNFIPGIYALVVKTSGTTSYTIDFQTGFTTTATLATGTGDGRYFTITFVCDGVGMREVARTAAMLPY